MSVQPAYSSISASTYDLEVPLEDVSDVPLVQANANATTDIETPNVSVKPSVILGVVPEKQVEAEAIIKELLNEQVLVRKENIHSQLLTILRSLNLPLFEHKDLGSQNNGKAKKKPYTRVIKSSQPVQTKAGARAETFVSNAPAVNRRTTCTYKLVLKEGQELHVQMLLNGAGKLVTLNVGFQVHSPLYLNMSVSGIGQQLVHNANDLVKRFKDTRAITNRTKFGSDVIQTTVNLGGGLRAGLNPLISRYLHLVKQLSELEVPWANRQKRPQRPTS